MTDIAQPLTTVWVRTREPENEAAPAARLVRLLGRTNTPWPAQDRYLAISSDNLDDNLRWPLLAYHTFEVAPTDVFWPEPPNIEVREVGDELNIERGEGYILAALTRAIEQVLATYDQAVAANTRAGDSNPTGTHSHELARAIGNLRHAAGQLPATRDQDDLDRLEHFYLLHQPH